MESVGRECGASRRLQLVGRLPGDGGPMPAPHPSIRFTTLKRGRGKEAPSIPGTPSPLSPACIICGYRESHVMCSGFVVSVTNGGV